MTVTECGFFKACVKISMADRYPYFIDDPLATCYTLICPAY